MFITKSHPKLASIIDLPQTDSRDFVPWLASCKVIGDPGPHVSMTWVWMRVTGLGMVPVSPHHAFRAKNPPQFGTRLGYLTAQSKALFARILHCVAALEGADSSLTTPYSFHDREKVFDAAKQFDTTTCSACSLQNLILNWLQIWHSVSPKLASLAGILFCGWPPARLLGILTLMFPWHGYEWGLQVLRWYPWAHIMPFQPKSTSIWYQIGLSDCKK